ncbi:MAG: hypothetical protein H6712_30750 [Myxococcales bacterium]|nr:hypothetical protein [Myxococcales bacterium]MCB9718270.1 hypothetical protein [Myxococcales bacterium]
MLPPKGATTVVCAAGPVRLSASEEGGVELGYDADALDVLLRVREAIELRDGDLVCAGRQWLSFELGRDGRLPRLHLLDPMGEIHMTLSVRGGSLTLGREAGDVVLPWDDQLGELHLQVLVRGDTVFVQNLVEHAGTWVLVRPGEVVPSGSTLAVGDRVMEVGALDRWVPRDAAVTVPDPDGQTRIFAAA